MIKSDTENWFLFVQLITVKKIVFFGGSLAIIIKLHRCHHSLIVVQIGINYFMFTIKLLMTTTPDMDKENGDNKLFFEEKK